MGVRLLTFDDALNTAKNDAFFNYYLTNKKNGIFKDLGDAVEPSTSSSKITFKDGFVSVYGRRVYIENGTSVNVTLDSTKKGFVILEIDTAKNKATIKLKEGSSTNYPGLIQLDLLETDGIHEFILVGYTKTTTSITLDKSVIRYIYTNQTEIDKTATSIRSEMEEMRNDLSQEITSHEHEFKVRIMQYPTRKDKTFKFNLPSEATLCDGFYSFVIMGNPITISTNLVRNSTCIVFNYRYLGSDYSGQIEKSGSQLFITVGDVGHNMKYAYVIF